MHPSQLHKPDTFFLFLPHHHRTMRTFHDLVLCSHVADTPLAIRWATHYVYKVQFDPSQINKKTKVMNKARTQRHVCTLSHARVHKCTQASPGMLSGKGQVVFESVLGHNSVFKWRLWPDDNPKSAAWSRLGSPTQNTILPPQSILFKSRSIYIGLLFGRPPSKLRRKAGEDSS